MVRWSVETGKGEVTVVADEKTADPVVVLAHGAGSHMEHKTIGWLSSIVRQAGGSVVRMNFLYRCQGKSMPDRMPTLSSTYKAVIESVRERLDPDTLIIGGHSMGGRVASVLMAEQSVADGLLLFGYPLHPPGQPDKLRDGHLSSITTPVLQINRTRDDFCTIELMDSVFKTLRADLWRLHWIEAADHSYSVNRASGRTRRDVEEEVVAQLKTFFQTLKCGVV